MPEIFAIGDEDELEEAYHFDVMANRSAATLQKFEAELLYLRTGHSHNMNVSQVPREDEETLRQWAWSINLSGNMKTPMQAAVLLDVGGVLARLNTAALANLEWDLTHEDMTGIGVFICTRGEYRWRELLTQSAISVFCRGMTGTIITRYLQRYSRNRGVRLKRTGEMPLDFICLSNGDKGDAASILGVPVILFDDRLENIWQVEGKGIRGSKGVLVKGGRRWAWHKNETVPLASSEWKRMVKDWLQTIGVRTRLNY